MLKPFECYYLVCSPFLPPLYRQVRSELCRIAGVRQSRADILDVGGRKSHYTIGVQANVTISDLPRQSDIQNLLNLGINEQMLRQIRRRRSNVEAVIYDDLTRTRMANDSFDIVVAVEVLEHVDEDALFVRNVKGLLRKGGVFLMTTPNGDATPVPHNLDHRRHYRRDALLALLQTQFPKVEMRYAIRAGRCRSWGLKSWSATKPVQTLKSMAGNLLNGMQSALPGLAENAMDTRHLLAICWKDR